MTTLITGLVFLTFGFGGGCMFMHLKQLEDE